MLLRYRIIIIAYLFVVIIFPQVVQAASVTHFTLVNAANNSDILTIENDSSINLSALSTANLNIRANTSPASVESVSLSLSGATEVSRVEGVAPYTLWGDQGGNYNNGTLNLGFHTLSAIPTDGGSQGSGLSVSFTVMDNSSGMPRADGGSDQTLILPESSTVLVGEGADPDGVITDYQWTQISGPTTADLSGENTPTLSVFSLSEGTYTMRLTVTDNDGNTAFDDISIYVIDPATAPDNPTFTGELKKWHKITLTFTGPASSETATINPFTDYRLDVTFIQGSTIYKVPGYFAADGDAANSGASAGNKWRVHFAPDQVGTWNYAVSFRNGANIAASDDPAVGTAVAPLDSITGSFTIAGTDKTGRDHRGKGRLQYVGKHYLQFSETKEYFLKQGADAPENFLAYEDFDNTPNYGNRRKSWSAHIGDWQDGDPTWMSDKGKGIIGALNYLASEGMNAFSFIPMNIGGDDKNVFPYISDDPGDRTRFDCSKLDQWERVFEHADKIGMFLHFKTQETENELLLDNGNMGVERKLYYRELIARFGHHLALNWNLGEEINDATTAQKKAWAQYFYDNDPYHHHIVIHNMGNPHYDLLGPGSKLTGFSLQTSKSDFSTVHSRVKNYLTRSADAGKPWAVACDEPGDASHALRPDDDAGDSHEDGRKNALWGTFMAGGWGNEWYFGYQHAHSDLTCEDFRSRDNWWDYCRYALEFFIDNSVPFWQMQNDNNISTAANDYAFYQNGEIYVVYLKEGGSTELDLSNFAGLFEIKWFNPRSGGSLQNGTITTVKGGDWTSLGNPPDSPDQDWTILVRKSSAKATPWMYLLLDDKN